MAGARAGGWEKIKKKDFICLERVSYFKNTRRKINCLAVNRFINLLRGLFK
jgi:hypothetical protein